MCRAGVGRRSCGSGGEGGLILVGVLVLMMITFLLVSMMLFASSQEVRIAGLHRDGVRAEEGALAGLTDAAARMMSGRPWKPGAVAPADVCVQDDGSRGYAIGSPAADVCVVVATRLPGPGGAFHMITAEAMAGAVRRRLSAVVLSRATTALPGMLVVRDLSQDGGTSIGSGDVYAHTSVRYRDAGSAARTTYAGWRIRLTDPAPGVGPCYTHAECAALGWPGWWPGHRRAVYRTDTFRAAALPGNPQLDPRTATGVLGYACPGGPPPAQRSQTIGSDGPGFQPGDRRADLTPSDPAQAVTPIEPLYGCTSDGLPYTWIREAFDSDDDPDADPDQFMWGRVVPFESWFARYLCFDEQPGALAWRPCNGFHTDPAQGDPSLGAIPPPLAVLAWAQNYDQRHPGGMIDPAVLAWGTCADPPECRDPANTPQVIRIDASAVINCAGVCPSGHGALVVRGDLEVNGSFTFYGTVVVSGVLIVGSGTIIVHGDVSAAEVRGAAGALRLFPGTAVAGGAWGPLAVSRRAWWER